MIKGAMMRVVIVGAGGHAKVVLENITAANTHEVVGLVDEKADARPPLWGKYPLLGGDDVLPELRKQGVQGAIIAIGDNRARARMYEKAAGLGFEMINAVHPGAWISPSAVLGTGIAIMAGVVINADAQIKDNTIINTGATVDHDVLLEDHAQIAPGCHLGGLVHVGTGALIGIGASVIHQKRVGNWSIVGGGAVVTKDIPDHCLAKGVPAVFDKIQD